MYEIPITNPIPPENLPNELGGEIVYLPNNAPNIDSMAVGLARQAVSGVFSPESGNIAIPEVVVSPEMAARDCIAQFGINLAFARQDQLGRSLFLDVKKQMPASYEDDRAA